VYRNIVREDGVSVHKSTTGQALPLSAIANNRLPDEPDPLPGAARNDAAWLGDVPQSRDLTTVKEALAQLTSEYKALQETLDEERRLRAELSQALARQCQAASTDPLTGLYNRRAMDQQLSEIWNGHGSAQLSVLLLDIDHFKHINDTYGHPRGDQVIRQVAEALRRCLRAGDSAFRYGGEEFLVLLPNTTLEGAMKVAEAIRGRIESLHQIARHADPVPCTVSLGVAACTEQDDRDSLFRRADHALYQAKHLGRNRVEVDNRMN
jgi:diguanylate cyclase (GGDEF)-like protein